MSSGDISKPMRYAGDALSADPTNWSALRTMTDTPATDAARADPDAPPLRLGELRQMRPVPSVKLLRQRLAMTQASFAQAFHLPITTLRDWEQRRSLPDAPARALLWAIERDPDVMRRLLADAAA
jgi:putative transcriptional regulator